jgi:hypothetical protein
MNLMSRSMAAEGGMSHREKVAWLSLLAITVAIGPYFLLTALRPPEGGAMPDLAMLTRFAVAAVAQVVILGIGHIVLRLRSPDDARAPADERDRAIERRSVRLAYYVSITGLIVVGVVMPFSESGWAIINAAVAAIVISELVQYGVAVHSYRRAWSD